jgi:hypothetical protein
MKLDIEAQEQMVVKQWLALKLQAEIEAGAIGYENNGKTQREGEAHQVLGLAETKRCNPLPNGPEATRTCRRQRNCCFSDNVSEWMTVQPKLSNRRSNSSPHSWYAKWKTSDFG